MANVLSHSTACSSELMREAFTPSVATPSALYSASLGAKAEAWAAASAGAVFPPLAGAVLWTGQGGNLLRMPG
eukprot:1200755-Pyramimonas_sp.AAC.1